MSKPFGTYDYVPRVKKVKHVKMFEADTALELETSINDFADRNPNCKILGVRIAFNPLALAPGYFAAVTYLEDAKNGQMVYDGDDDGSDEERDSD